MCSRGKFLNKYAIVVRVVERKIGRLKFVFEKTWLRD